LEGYPQVVDCRFSIADSRLWWGETPSSPDVLLMLRSPRSALSVTAGYRLENLHNKPVDQLKGGSSFPLLAGEFMKTSHRLVLLVLSFSWLTGAVAQGATHTLAITVNGSGTVSRNPTNAVYPNGAVVILTANAATGWMFTGWSGSVSEGLNPLNLIMDADKVVTASFAPIPIYEVTVGVSGQGSVTPPGGNYQSNTLVTLSATPADGWVFGQWTGDTTSTANPLAFRLTANQNVTAVFGQPPALATQPQGATVPVGSPFQFSVEAEGTGPLTYGWQKDGLPLKDATSSTLSIAQVSTDDAGEYRVLVGNAYGETLSQAAKLAIEDVCSGPNVVAACTETALRDAISRGGVVRFCCNGVITLTSTIEITRDVALDARAFSVGISGNNAVRLFKVMTNAQFSVTNVALLNGRYLGTNGNSAENSSAVPQPGEDGFGGALLNEGGIVQLVSCLLSNNWSQGGRAGVDDPSANPRRQALAGIGGGGAIMNLGGTLYLDSVYAVSNTTVGGLALSPFFNVPPCGPGLGGALGSQQGVVVINDSTFVGNLSVGRAGQAQASRSGFSRGGAIDAEESSVSISRSTFLGNVAFVETTGQGGIAGSSFGGALSVASGSAAVGDSWFEDNRAQGGQGFRGSGTGAGEGGALYNLGVLEVENCSFTSNQALAGNFSSVNESGRGGAFYNGGTASLVGSTLHHNLARGGAGGSFGLPGSSNPGGDGLGGAIFNRGNVSATNSTLAWNRAEGGDASGNEASVPGGIAAGGALYNAGESVFLMNVTLANNSVQPGLRTSSLLGANIANTNGVLALRNSLVAYGDGAGNGWGIITDSGFNISSDGSCDFQSGSSFNFTDPKLDDLADNGGPTLTMALLPESPAIDFGTTVGAPSVDQRGTTRPSGDGVDIGAFEVRPAALRLFIRLVDTTVTVSFVGQEGKTYDLETTPDLGSAWVSLETIGPLAGNGVVSRNITTAGSQAYLRLKAH
jgi:hypothetical protein